MIMKNYLLNFIASHGYLQEDFGYIEEVFDGINSNSQANGIVTTLLDEYAKNKDFPYSSILTSIEEISTLTSLPLYAVNLVVNVLLTKPLKEHYISHKLPLDVYENTVMDLTYKYVECKLVKKQVGIFAKWFDKFFDLTRFGLGRLQFELRDLKMPFELNGKYYPENTTVINVHIPRTGTRLDRAEVLKAYEKASKFFKSDFIGKDILISCHSWLLFPENFKMLKKDSNILRFISDYTMIDSGNYENYSELWRLFDIEIPNDLTLLPEDTSFRKAYKEYVLSGKPTGYGVGVFKYN